MDIQTRLVSDGALISIRGRVTITDGSAVLDDTLRRCIEDGTLKLVLDCAEVPYIDSTALGVLMRAHATVTRRGGTLKLRHVRGHVRQLLELTRLLPVLEAYESEGQSLGTPATFQART